MTEPVKELELENRLIAKIRASILELGKGFSFIGNQYRLEYNGKEYFVDMLSGLISQILKFSIFEVWVQKKISLLHR
ncbi:PDDEXK nuclease domain-containing protein [Algoriphagus sp. Y33]|uniref:PDDEXK nuclease domain-containing protein n=1 Tax=Algoriphagus sp. Y33 TaxID=2772483 RepID=UPI001CE0CCA7|nr:PDDEXK nuclease domain-containing protein [Algoriphagus sp. Y33]